MDYSTIISAISSYFNNNDENNNAFSLENIIYVISSYFDFPKDVTDGIIVLIKKFFSGELKLKTVLPTLLPLALSLISENKNPPQSKAVEYNDESYPVNLEPIKLAAGEEIYSRLDSVLSDDLNN